MNTDHNVSCMIQSYFRMFKIENFVMNWSVIRRNGNGSTIYGSGSVINGSRNIVALLSFMSFKSFKSFESFKSLKSFESFEETSSFESFTFLDLYVVNGSRSGNVDGSGSVNGSGSV